MYADNFSRNVFTVRGRREITKSRFVERKNREIIRKIETRPFPVTDYRRRLFHLQVGGKRARFRLSPRGKKPYYYYYYYCRSRLKRLTKYAGEFPNVKKRAFSTRPDNPYSRRPYNDSNIYLFEKISSRRSNSNVHNGRSIRCTALGRLLGSKDVNATTS